MTNEFYRYAEGGFGTEILPIMPPDAVVNPAAPDVAELSKKRGKVPGRKTDRGWFGFVGWTKHTTTPADHMRWGGWNAGTGLQGRLFPAVDIDIDDPELAAAVQNLAESILGDAPCRFGREPRRLLVYAGADHGKRRLVFRRAIGGMEGAVPATADTAGASGAPGEQAVELLANRQQYVVEGVHPKTGLPYYWAHGRSPAEVGAANLVVITAQQLDEFYGQVEILIVAHGYSVVSHSEGLADAVPVSQESLLAPNFDMVRRAMASIPNEVDRDGWVRMCAALKASAGLEHEAEAAELFMEWSMLWAQNTPEGAEAMWASMQPPYRVGWPYLSQFATEHGDGTFSAAQEEFDPVTDAPLPGNESKGPLISKKVQAVFDRWVWVERLQRMCDLETGELLNREQFNVRNSHIGDPTSTKDCAWAVLTRNSRRLQAVKNVTYRPGQGLFVTEDLPDLQGTCLNLWRDPGINLPASASDAEVQQWLDHVAFVVPNAEERETVLSWFAWIIQNPGEKPNWALVIGSIYEGLGKDLMMEPVRVALGGANVREITPEDLDSQYTWYLKKTRLVLVEEMKLSERKATMNKLKPLIAAPPYTLSVNEKFQPQYEIPNLIAAVFFTNAENALAITSQGRRYFVTFNDGPPRDAEYYKHLVAWYRAGGAALAARWLLQRDVKDFDAQGRAPDTEAKKAMVQAGRSLLDELIEDDIRDGEGVFADLRFTVDELVGYIRDRVKDFRMTNNGVAAVLRRNGFVALGRVALGEPPPGCRGPLTKGRRESTVFGRRGDELEGAALADIRAAYWAERRSDETQQSMFREAANDRMFS